MEDLTGKQFGHYQIVAPLGEGGMAAVYKAYQPSMERFVAVKVLPRHMAESEEFINRFRREARLLAQLQHPHILPVFDYGESDGYPYIVMPFVESGTLSELLQKRRLALPEIRRIMVQIGDALGYAHARGMIHRDIKPSNVLIDPRGNCLLTDFGLARMTESATKITTSGTVMGTPAYMSPEQGAGSDIDHRSDIYSLGIILYEMVTGRVPFTAETPVAIVFKHIQDPLPSARKFNPDLPESVELVLLKALAKSPQDRYQTAEDFVQAIQGAIPESGVTEQVSRKSALSASASVTELVTSDRAAETEVRRVAAVQTVQVPESTPETEAVSAKSVAPRRSLVPAFVGIGVIAVIALAALFAMRMIRANRTASPSATRAAASTTVPVNPPTPAPTSAPQIEISTGEFFRDVFEGQLAEGWMWLEENPAKWSLTASPGELQIVASDSSFDGPNLPSNILLRAAPAGDFEITTSLRFTPTSNFQFAGLVVFQDHGNALQFGRAYCNASNTCVGDGIYFDNFENGSATGANYAAAFREPVIHLRLRRTGNTYTGYYSGDGVNWVVSGEHSRDFSPVRVGLMAAQAERETPARFEDFILNAPSVVALHAEINCRVGADDGSDVRIRLESGATAWARGVSLDNRWLNIQSPENPGASCWIPIEPGDLKDNKPLHTVHECADPLGCVQIGAGEPFHFAFWGVLSGSEASIGRDIQRGIEIAVDDIGGKIHDRDILLTTQDALCTQQGGAAAARRIAMDETVVALIGSACSSETIGGIEILTKAGLTTISPSNTRTRLTDANRGPEYAGFLRTAHNDLIQGRVVAEFAYHVLGARTAATVYDESVYSSDIQQVFVDEFTRLGGQIVAQEAISSNSTNMHGLLTRIADESPDLLYYPVFAAAGSRITIQAREIADLENVRLISSDAVFTPEFLRLTSDSAEGMYISSPDFSQFSGAYNQLVERYISRYGEPPISSFHAQAYDATNIILAAVRKIALVGSDGTIYIPRLALRDALYATKDFPGVTGGLTCTPTGDCGAPVIAVYQVLRTDPSAWNPLDTANPNPKKVYP